MSDEALLQRGVESGARAGLIRRPFWLGEAVEVVVWSAVWVALWAMAAALAVNYGISAWYPPAAISLFVLIRYGRAAAPAILAASLLAGADQWGTYPEFHAFMGSLGHVASYFAAAQLYRSRTNGQVFSIRPNSISSFIYSAILGAGFSSLLGNLNIDIASDGSYQVTIERWFA